MTNEKPKKKLKNAIWLLSLFSVCLLMAGYYFFVQYPQIRAAEQTLSDAQNRLDSETEKKEQLVNQKEAVSSDEYIENIARSELNMLKQNEKVFIDISKSK